MTVKEILSQVTDETTIEEARRYIIDALEQNEKDSDDLEALKENIHDLEQSVQEYISQVDYLKEENGRLYRDRARNIADESYDVVDKVIKSEDEQKAEREAEIEKLEKELEIVL